MSESMSRIARFSVLDLKALKPYALALLFPLLLIVPFAWVEPAVMLSALPLLVAIMGSSFVFSLDESAGLELLYGLLPGSRKDAVFGRYALLLAALVVTVLLGCLVAATSVLAGHSSGVGYFAVAASSLCSGLLFLSIQMPLFFRYGYMRARYWGYAAFMVVFAAIGALLLLAPDTVMLFFEGPLPLLLVALMLGVYGSSAMWSAKAVARREL